MSLAIGVDVGGTKIAAGVVDLEGRVVRQDRRESPARDVAAIERTIVDLVQDLRGDDEIVGVGVAAAGFVDASRSTVMFAPNLAWRDTALRAELEAQLDLPCVVENDANAAAWGEFTFGAAVDADDMLLVTIGTGIGGGLIFDGQLWRGAFGVAAEIGHLRAVPSGILCGCGNRGCWEMYGSGSALVRRTREDLMAGSLLGRDLLDRAGGDVTAVTGPMISEAAQAGDEFAVEQITELGRWVGEGIASLTAVLDPGVIAVGGGVSEVGDLFLGPVREAYRSQLTGRGHRPEAELRLATLGNRAGLLGAADLARRP